jgi:hypothetical protein
MSEGQWQFHFDAFKGTRILRSRFFGITTSDLNLWWSYEHKKWLPLEERGVQGASSTVCCHSFKAFKSHLRRHPELQAVGNVILCSRFVGHDITARWSKELKARPFGCFVIKDPNRYLSKLVGSAGL